MNTGIYCIEHKDSGKKYVGSAGDFSERWKAHRHLLRKNKHYAVHLQYAWNKYGGDAFEFRKLLICSPENLLMYEQLCIDGYGVLDDSLGYNTAPVAGSRKGVGASAETRAKMSFIHKGKKRSAEWRANMSKAAKTKRPSIHTKLSYAKAREIRAVFAGGGKTYEQLGLEHNVSRELIGKVVRNERWIDE